MLLQFYHFLYNLILLIYSINIFKKNTFEYSVPNNKLYAPSHSDICKLNTLLNNTLCNPIKTTFVCAIQSADLGTLFINATSPAKSPSLNILSNISSSEFGLGIVTLIVPSTITNK